VPTTIRTTETAVSGAKLAAAASLDVVAVVDAVTFLRRTNSTMHEHHYVAKAVVPC